MNLRAYVLLSLAAFLLYMSGCQQSPTEPTATKTSSISGTVVDAANSSLALARVIDIGSLARVDTSKTDGSYKLMLELSDNYNTSLYAILPGYVSDTTKVSIKPGDNLTNVNLRMKVQDSSRIVGGNSGRAASIGLVTQTAKSIMLKGGIIDQSSTLTFLVVDSLNRPVTGVNKCLVKFSLSVGHPSGESLKPDTAQTDPTTGQVSTTVLSGTYPNAILVTAQVIDPVRRIAATASLTEGTRLPDGNHVSISASKFNIAGRVYDGLSTTVTMTANDQFGNPVADGTPVSFVTSGGGIIKDAFTKSGSATAVLTSGGGNPPIGGLATVTAEMKGDTSVRKADSSIVRTIQILFSGPTTITRSANTVNFEVPDGDMNYFDFSVSDDYGNPLVEGSSINVTVESFNDKLQGSVSLKGDNKITMLDTKDGARTHFRIWVIDKNKDSVSGVITFRINIQSPNGIVDEDWFSGYMRGATSGNGSFGVPASISLADSSSRKLFLAETQLPDTSTRLTFIVRDGNGSPIINATRKALVTFSLLQAPNGTYLSNTQDSTGAGGGASVTVNAGNTPGIAQVVARTSDGFGNFFSALSVPIEVAHGLPDSNQIFLSLEKNMFNDMGNQVGTLRVNLADINGNFPAPQYLQFNTSGGVVSPIAALLDANGRASTGLYGGKVPIDPIPGYGNVSVILKVHGGVKITRKIPFLFSGAPIITTLDLPPSDTLIVFDGGSPDVNFNVADENGNPIVAGNSISIGVSGFAASGITLTNDNGITDGSNTKFLVRISDSKPNDGTISGDFIVTITVNGPSGRTTRQFHGVLRGPQAIVPPSPSAKLPAQIAFLTITSNDIYVHGVGALENSVITYEVRDSLGLPIERSPRSFATFDAQFFPNTFTNTGTSPRLIPSSDSTDDQGRLRVSVNSGTQAGALQVVARIDLGGGNVVSSQPVKISVHAGFPDQQHFTIAPDHFNHAGLDKFFVTDLITVHVVDKYSNPVLPGTAVYFNTTHGSIGTGSSNTSRGLTDLDGFVSQTLWSDNPSPEVPALLPSAPPWYLLLPGAVPDPSGWTKVYARTLGDGLSNVIDSIDILWTGAPIVTLTSGPAIFAVPNAGSAGPWSFTVVDRFGHPMSAGTQITVACGDAIVDGDANVTLGDYVLGGSGVTNFNVIASDSDPIDGKPIKPALLVVTVIHPIYGKRSWTLASGTTD